MTCLCVIKRDGTFQDVSVDKITLRIERISQEFDIGNICYTTLGIKTLASLTNNMPTKNIDVLIAEIAANMSIEHPDYSKLAAVITISNLHQLLGISKNYSAGEAFIDRMKCLKDLNLITTEYFNQLLDNRQFVADTCKYIRDYNYEYRGIMHLLKSVVCRYKNQVFEVPQEMHMRVAFALGKNNLKVVAATYELLSCNMYTHATPTILNAGTPSGNLSSCFLNSFDTACTQEIYETLKNCAIITENSGGLGIAMSNVPAKGTILDDGTYASGLIPLIRQFQEAVLYAQKGGQKRRGGLAVYLEPWHAEIEDFINLKRNAGPENSRARYLFYGIWNCDLFMDRVKNNSQWSVFCPFVAPGLDRCYGIEFQNLYLKYESAGKAYKVIDARTLWFSILSIQIETGGPYIVYKDICNSASNQNHLGTIRCSNLCTEIIQYSDTTETGVCNLASISLPRFVETNSEGFKFFNHTRLYSVVKHIVGALNNVIDNTNYPVESAKTSNLRHRPIGIGIQGLADTFFALDISYEPEDSAKLPYADYPALQLNTEIYETLAFAAYEASGELAKIKGPHASYAGSQASQGILHYHHYPNTKFSGRWDFKTLEANQLKYGLYNSLLIAQMPTAGTSISLGNNESFEPYLSNLYNHKTITGDCLVANSSLVRELISSNLWNSDLINQIVAAEGSVQGISNIPRAIRTKYKTAFEIKIRTAIRFAEARAGFIDQAQSFNVYMEVPNKADMSTFHFMAWTAKLKSSLYYFRTRHATQAAKMTIQHVNSSNCSLDGVCGA